MIALFQFNVAIMRAPYSSQLWDKWRQLVPVIHSQVDNADGFLWRYDGTETDDGYIAPYPHDPLIMGNLSAWENPRKLHRYTFGPGSHGALLEHRSKWFIPWPEGVIYNVMWWAPIVAPNTEIEYAKKQLLRLHAHGNSSEVFDWNRVSLG